MKTVQAFLVVILLGSIISSCSPQSKPPATLFGESMKGYELYSWQDGNQWKFSILVGTNREKTLDEIKTADVLLSSVDELKSTLEKIPAGQYVMWSSRETLSFPPDEVIKQIQQTCEELGLILTIAS